MAHSGIKTNQNPPSSLSGQNEYAASIVEKNMTELDEIVSLMTGDEKHQPSSHSTRDIIWVLYDKILNVNPRNIKQEDRDRFLLSKGHGPMAYYAILAKKGFFPYEWLSTYGEFDSPLGYHPDHALIPGVEISSGSLGHGLPIGVGIALGLKIKGIEQAKVWVLMGDAELDEGSNFEAITFAGSQKLDNLNVIVIDNESASLGWPGGIESRFSIEGWSTVRIDGRDHRQIEQALILEHKTKPHLVVGEVERKDGKPRL